jgi:hypothetical protein
MRTIPVLFAIASFAAIAAFALWGQPSLQADVEGGSVAEGASDSERLARLERELAELRVLVSQRNGRAPASARTARPVVATREDTGRDAARLASALQASFRAEPADPKWAARTQADLEGMLAATAAEQPDFPAPEDARIVCRSRSCRIEARYPDEDSALFGVQLLQSAFASRFPRTHQHSVANADGSTTVVMYARGRNG